MNKLSFEALKNRAEAVVSEQLLNSISGGTENSCHPGPRYEDLEEPTVPADNTRVGSGMGW